jgi:hypothetical protein
VELSGRMAASIGPDGIELRWVSDVAQVPDACASIRARAAGAIAVDLEGVDLGRHGEICIIQVTTSRRGTPIFLFDVVALGKALFSGGDGLAGLLEDPSLKKLFWDVRSDASALFFQFGVQLRGAVDLQLHDVAQRKLAGIPCFKISSLGFVCEKTRLAQLTEEERERLAAVKGRALEMFSPAKGGSYAVWKQRPLPACLLEYCCDSALFFSLLASYTDQFPALLPGGAFWAALDAAVARRLALATSDAWESADKETVIGIDEALLADLKAAGAVFPAPAGVGKGRGTASGGRGGRGGTGGEGGGGAAAGASEQN